MISRAKRREYVKRILAALMLVLLGAVAGGNAVFVRINAGRVAGGDQQTEARPIPGNDVVLACPGRIEGLSEIVKVCSGMDGTLAAVLVSEGDQVSAGQTLARIDRPDLADEFNAATAAAESARQARIRIRRGSRQQERDAAAAETAAAQAVFKQAQTHYQRIAQLFEKGVVPADARDEARKELDVAESQFRAVSEREKLIDEGPLQEELARADADVNVAEHRVRAAHDNLEKCRVRAPISGRVLRREMKPGETVSVVFPQPILSLADTSRLRVRAEVDERDIGRVFPGQRVLVQADAFPQLKFAGTIANAESLMGRKKVRTGDPAEKSDRDVLEVLADLEDRDPRLVIGLRVTVQFIGTRKGELE
jgi:ABC exporter DevB family membrane fusion protein